MRMACSPHERQRHAGDAGPEYRSAHPGYASAVARMSASDMRGDRHQSKDVDARDKPGHDGWLLVETLVPDIALLIRATIPPRLEEDRSPFPTAGTALRPLASPRSAD